MDQKDYGKKPYRPFFAVGGRTRGPYKLQSASRRMQEITQQKKARNTLADGFGVLAALVITALLAAPHLVQEPQEVTAQPEAMVQAEISPSPSAAPTPVVLLPEDPCLVLVNETHPLPAGYAVTPRLYGGIEVNALMYTDLCALLEDAWSADCVLWIASGYRDVETQSSILEQAVENRMKQGMTREAAYEDARLTIQAPGYSEHHTGLAVDFNEVNYAFEDTKEYDWLTAHAAEYGFVQRYPADKVHITGIDYEPWHYRYVGWEHALAMQKLQMCLEEYVAYLQSGGVN